MELKDNIEEFSSSDIYYDFFDGGYLEPEDFLENKEDIEKVNEAAKVLNEYFNALESSDKYEEI